ncbi:hypothetical protein BJ085DRAFT_31940 [Dimargaris cristalligena]|uniref:Uncharacterized protein n=1 Tax=Dimargaris cristalligena TaxID=215637 RepID=A0A4P9ZZ19_9FUNG|nr:hypothetical protein BJ085DRAFT_31940 [Dimargaris cristalligena]|eukprot:RKP38638.1 hypothetical protein BJ085DRAFT_31940 [Dimargaris cristalligena]
MAEATPFTLNLAPALLERLSQDLEKSPEVQEGFLIGRVIHMNHVTSGITDDSDDGRAEFQPAHSMEISDYHPWNRSDPKFYNPDGSIDGDILHSWGIRDKRVVGYYHYRGQSPNYPSMREMTLTGNLRDFLLSCGLHGFHSDPFILGVLTAAPTEYDQPLPEQSAPPSLPLVNIQWSFWNVDQPGTSLHIPLKPLPTYITTSLPTPAVSLSLDEKEGLRGIARCSNPVDTIRLFQEMMKRIPTNGTNMVLEHFAHTIKSQARWLIQQGSSAKPVAAPTSHRLSTGARSVDTSDSIFNNSLFQLEEEDPELESHLLQIAESQYY